MGDDLNTRCTTALRALEAAGVIRSAWLPNQQFMSSPNGYPFVVMRVYGSNVVATDRHNAAKSYTPSRRKRWTHDLSDPVTAASLIVLVREAWGREGLHACRRGRGIWCVSHDPWMHASKVSQGSTEAEALVAALEARVAEIPS